jgi:orotidine-5'-phosphate decarboxylase
VPSANANSVGPAGVEPPGRGVPQPPSAAQRLAAAVADADSPLSVGLEPDPSRLPSGFDDTPAGHERFLRLIVDAAAPHAAAFKANLAFFEAMGPAGFDLLFRIRDAVPADRLFIADAKRGDIGSTAERYAHALLGELDADAVTVNPLMGWNTVEPFLAWSAAGASGGGDAPRNGKGGGRIIYLLCATSNPSAADFLLPEPSTPSDGPALFESIAAHAERWQASAQANSQTSAAAGITLGLVVGATVPPSIAQRVRAAAPTLPWLVPGLGAQGGDAHAIGAHARARAAAPPLFHVTRSVLPTPADAERDPAAVIADNAERLGRELAAAIQTPSDPTPTQHAGASQ